MKEKVSEVNRFRDGDSQLPVGSVKNCMEATTIHVLGVMREIEGADIVEQAMGQIWQI